MATKQVTLTVANITNNNVPCDDPIILVVGHSGSFAFPCKDKIDSEGNIKFSVPEDEFVGGCLNLVIKCDSCDHCKEEEVTACLCNTTADCQSCHECINGICISKCLEGEICHENTCCECNSTTPCPTGFYCDGCKCRCNGFINSAGICVECLNDGNCGNCENCINNFCTEITCPNNLICISGECGCPPGSKYDVATNSCVPADDCTKDSDCGICETCVAGNCTPIVCPKDHKCVNGECVYWPCTNTTCENGGDCGKDCGCVDGECVPCYILECNGQCENALGCRCNSLAKCEPVNDCGQYCDGNTPCLDANCTCYNNRCVNCSNFPCDPDQCSDKYNCGCVDGDCGGNGCNDKFELKKNENCTADGCELEAIYTTTNKCHCDPVEFRTKVYVASTEQGPGLGSPVGPPKVMVLNVRLYKNNIPYDTFKDIATMGDDELVDATIRTTITHKINGAVVTPAVAPVNTVSVDGLNKVPNIDITSNHVSKTINGVGTTVTIEVRAENVKVASNGCIDYKSKVIAVYELDYRTVASTAVTASKIASTYSLDVSTKLSDNKSTRKPLFVWYKSNTGVFSLNKYVNNGTYSQSGFFRKEYGINSGTNWTSKINNPAKQVLSTNKNELWNNLNYRATIDCGCGGGSGATLQNVVFCCTENIDYTISNCGKTITIPPFSVCSVNKNLTSLNSTGYTIPAEAQTYFWMIINGNVEKLLRQEGGEIISAPYVYNHDTNISSVAFEQRYVGSAIVPVACGVEYTEDYEGPDYNVASECGKVTVTKQASSPTITSVTGKKGTTPITFTPSVANTVWTATGGVLNMNGEIEVTVSFQNSCTLTKKVTITCQPEITAEPTDTFARGECPGGTNPDVVVSVVAGFSAAAKFSKDGITYVDPDTTTPTIQKTFTNFAAGTYTFYVKETINGVEVIDTDIVTINPMVSPSLSKVDICGNTQGSITIVGAAPTSTWKIYGPAFNGFTVTVGANGSSSPVQIPIDKDGQYIVKLVTDPTNSMCTGDLTIDVNKEGGVITPLIVKDGAIICNGAELFFRIDDGGLNLTYNIQLSSPNGGVLQDLNGNSISTLQANNTGTYTAKVVGLNNGASTAIYNIVITGIVNSGCYSITGGSVTTSYSVQPGPNIGIISVSCSNVCQRDCYDITVAISGTTTNVTIGGAVATLIAAGVWQKTGLQTLTPPIIIATNSGTGCTDTVTVSELPDCDARAQCPDQTILITDSPDSPTCGVGTVSLYYSYSTIPDIGGAEYRWYKTTGGIMQLLASGIVAGTTVPQLDVTSSFSTETYVLMLVTNNGICEYTSNEIDVYADTELAPEIYGAGISPDTTTLVTGQTYSYSTGFIPNGTYTWTLSNSNGANQPIGTNSNAISISSFTEGSNIIDLTVTNGICTGVASVELVVGLSCPTASLSLLGSTAGCEHIQAVFDSPGLQPGVTVSTWEWEVSYDGVTWLPTLQTGTGSIANFNTIEVFAGEAVDIRVNIVLSDGCNFSSSEIAFTRCNCICTNPTLSTTTCVANSSSLYSGLTIATRTREVGYYQTGDTFDWELGHDGTSPIQFIFDIDGVVFADTGVISRMESAGGCTTGSCPVGLQYLGDTPAASVIMNVGPTQLTGTTSALETVLGCGRLTGVGSRKVFISGSGAEELVIPNDGLLSVTVVTSSATGCGSYGTFSWKLTCS